MDWSWLTITAVAFIALSAIHGALRGMHKSLINLIFVWGVVGTFLFGFRFAYEMTATITDNEIIRTLAAAIGLLILAMTVFGIIAELVDRSELNLLLGTRINSGLGLIYGLVRGLFIIVVVWLAFSSLASEQIVDKAREKLPSAMLDAMAESLWELTPESWSNKAEEIKDQVVKQAKI